MLTPGAAQTLAEQLAGRYAQRIRDRLLAPGSRLPSVRQCATQQGVSASTVVAAYDRLLAQGLVEARRNRGFYVREAVAPRRRSPAPAAAGGVAPELAPVDATALIRAMFHNRAEGPQPGTGVFPPDWLETPFLATAVRRVTGPAALRSASLRASSSMTRMRLAASCLLSAVSSAMSCAFASSRVRPAARSSVEMTIAP